MAKASDCLKESGPFSEIVSGFQVRENQLALCDAIEDAINFDKVLIAEAGTGIGKTFAYLVPAIQSGKKIVISTGTKHLQDQLYHTDIPKVMKAMGATVSVSLLKGRANYLCLHRLDIAPHLDFIDSQRQGQLQQIKEWSEQTSSGDKSELVAISEDSLVWPSVTSTADNCLGGECDYWNDCFIVKARKEAQSADVLVINHYLLLADMTLKEDGFAELLPGAEAFIIDEAHQLHEVASRFFGDTITSRQLLALAQEAIAEQVKDASDMSDIRDRAEKLETSAHDFRLSLGETGSRQAWTLIKHKPAVVETLSQLLLSLSDLCDVLELASERSRGLEQCYQRCLLYKERAELFSHGVMQSKEEKDGTGFILWYETYPRSFMLHSTPIEISSLFRQYTRDFSASWVFTSATLQVNKNFNHFSNAMGIDDFTSGVWSSPFDYEKQSLLYLPPGMPEPSDRSYTEKLINVALPVLKASRGRAFILFTSYRAMNESIALLKNKIDYPILIQGELPKHQLLAQFREAGNAVLLGTSSFWEGVDVRGEALSCVIIDKLPFSSPGDPVMQGRIDAIKRTGGQPFMDYQVPQAVIALKQGVGRLIRDVNDYGVVVIGDPRLKSKAYGQIFLNSLPPMPVTQHIKDIESFFASRNPEPVLETACS